MAGYSGCLMIHSVRSRTLQATWHLSRSAWAVLAIRLRPKRVLDAGGSGVRVADRLVSRYLASARPGNSPAHTVQVRHICNATRRNGVDCHWNHRNLWNLRPSFHLMEKW